MYDSVSKLWTRRPSVLQRGMWRLHKSIAGNPPLVLGTIGSSSCHGWNIKLVKKKYFGKKLIANLASTSLYFFYYLLYCTGLFCY